MEIDFDLIDEAIVACIAKQNDPAKVTALFDLSGDIRAEIARLTEENRLLVEYVELIDPKRDWRIEEIEKMRNEPEVREGRLAIQPILARHREEASR